MNESRVMRALLPKVKWVKLISKWVKWISRIVMQYTNQWVTGSVTNHELSCHTHINESHVIRALLTRSRTLDEYIHIDKWVIESITHHELSCHTYINESHIIRVLLTLSRTLDQATQEASWKRVFDPVYPLLFDLYHPLTPNWSTFRFSPSWVSRGRYLLVFSGWVRSRWIPNKSLVIRVMLTLSRTLMSSYTHDCVAESIANHKLSCHTNINESCVIRILLTLSRTLDESSEHEFAAVLNCLPRRTQKRLHAQKRLINTLAKASTHTKWNRLCWRNFRLFLINKKHKSTRTHKNIQTPT